MPLIAITDIMDKQRQEKEQQEKSSSAAEPAGGTHNNNNDSSHADSKLNYRVDGPAPIFHSNLSEKLKRLSVIDTGLYRAADVYPEHKIEESTKPKNPAFDISLTQRSSSGDDRIRAQLPHRPAAQSHTKEDTTIEEPAIAGLTI